VPGILNTCHSSQLCLCFLWRYDPCWREGDPKVIQNLIPAVISKPISSVPLRVYSLDPWCTECAGSLGLFDDTLLVFRTDGFLDDLLDFVLGENALQSSGDAFGLCDIDTFAPIGFTKSRECLLELLRRIVVLDPCCYPNSLCVCAIIRIKCRLKTDEPGLTKSDKIGNSLGRTTFNPNISPVNVESWSAKASFHLGVGVNGFPAPSRAAPRKNGIISTETPYALRYGR
jgi:hypothetical protein